MGKEGENNQDYGALIRALSSKIEIDEYGDFTESNFGALWDGDWELMIDWNPYKICFKNESDRIFVKIFSPSSGEYAQRTWDALVELSELDLRPFPVLAPAALVDRALVFPLGEVKGKAEYLDEGVISIESREKIKSVVNSHGLMHLGKFDQIELLKVGEDILLADPIDDTMYELANFVRDSVD